MKIHKDKGNYRRLCAGYSRERFTLCTNDWNKVTCLKCLAKNRAGQERGASEMKVPEWAKAIEVDAIVETWDGVYAETERELIAAAPNALTTPITLDRIWGKLSQDARDNLYELIDGMKEAPCPPPSA